VLSDEEYERVLAEARLRYAGGEGLDATIMFMRSEGFWIIPCIKAVRTLLGVSLGEAKDLVHLSPAFADLREAHDAFHEMAARSLDLEDS
jgi:ribosomal protein L7/L12